MPQSFNDGDCETDAASDPTVIVLVIMYCPIQVVPPFFKYYIMNQRKMQRVPDRSRLPAAQSPFGYAPHQRSIPVGVNPDATLDSLIGASARRRIMRRFQYILLRREFTIGFPVLGEIRGVDELTAGGVQRFQRKA